MRKRTLLPFLILSLTALITLINSPVSLINKAHAATYETSGTITSDNVLETSGVATIDAFGYNLSSLPADTTAKIQFSQDGTTWYDSTGTQDAWDSLSQGDHTALVDAIDLSALNWSRNYFYYQVQFDTTDTSATPVLDSAIVHYSSGASVDTDPATYVTPNSATLNGEITVLEGGNATERGFEYGLTETATWSTSESGDFSAETFSLEISDLDPGTTYYYRAYATNPEGTGYGLWESITTGTYETSGTITSDNLLSDVGASQITAFGYNLSTLPADTTAKVLFSQDATTWYGSSGVEDDWDSLSSGDNTAENDGIDLSGLGWGRSYFYYKMQFDTSDTGASPILSEALVYYTGGPSVDTGADSDVDAQTATLSGEITALTGGNATERGFEYGLTETATWSVSETGDFSAETFSLDISDLDPGTTYYYRAYATNPEATGYGLWLSFTTGTYHSSGSITSGNLLSGETVEAITGFEYTMSSMPAGASATVQFSQDGSTWYNSAGVLDGTDSLEGLHPDGDTRTIDLKRLVWTDANFYYKIALTANSSGQSPVLDEVKVNYDDESREDFGPVGYWKFDEGEGTEVHDSTARGNNGDIVGATWQDESMCISGSCLYFDGTDDSVNGFSTARNVQTLSFWVRPISTTESFIDLTGSIYANASSGTVEGTGFTSPTVYVDGEESATITANAWHFVSITTDTAFNANGLVMGLANSDYFTGFLDEVRLYPYARTAQQILNDYAKGSVSAGASAVLGAASEAGYGSLSDGLVGYWDFNEGTGTALEDSSGNNNDGSLATSPYTPTWSIGKLSNGLSFNGSSYASIDRTAISSLLEDEITVSIWFKTPDRTESGWIIDTNNFGYDGFSNMFYTYNHASNMCFKWEIHTGSGLSSALAHDCHNGKTINNDTWYHLVGTYDGKNVKLYVNGSLDSFETHSGTLSNVGPPLLGIGAGYCGTTNYPDCANYLTGTLDEFRIYNRALSPAEIRALYDFAPGPIAHWKFDEGTGTSAADSSGNANTGTLTNGPTWTAGKYGKALSFDGMDDLVKISDQSLSSFTISTWVKPQRHNHDTFGEILGWVSGSDTDCRVGFGIHQNTNYYFSIGNFNNSARKVLAPVSFQTWTHVSAVFDGTYFSIYKDGVLAQKGTYGCGLTPTIWGYIASSNTVYDYKGLIDDVRIYDYARSQKQIIEDMNAGHPAGGSPVGSQIGYWKFDEGYGSTAHDSSIHDNDGTIVGADWSNEGKLGKALDFVSANSDNVSVGDLGVDINSVCFWAKLDSTTEKIIDLDGGTSYIQAASGTVSAQGFTSPTIYINGKSASTITTDWAHVCAVTDTSFDANSVTIGKVGTDYLDGLVDELKIYNYALSVDEVRLEYNRGKALVLGSLGTDPADGTTASNSALSAYCVPGDTSTCRAPVGEWLFDEGTGDYAEDTSGNGNRGTLTGGPTWTAGKVGKALSFDGSDDYVEIADAENLRMGENYTLEAWYKPNSIAGRQTLISKYYTEYEMEFYNEGFFAYKYKDSAPGYETSRADYTYSKDTWYYAAIAVEGTTVRHYINGLLIGTNTVDTAGSDPTGTHALHIGKRSRDATNNTNGLIDQVRIYDYARTPAQIAWEYNQGAPIAWYRFDEGEGTTAYDASGNGNHGTLTNMDPATDYVTGKINTALDFDGDDDYVDVGTGSNDIRTVAFWLNTSSEDNNFIDLNGSAYINASGGTISTTGFTSPTIYVNGVESSSFSTGSWQHVVVKTDSEMDATDLDLGRIEGVGYLTGKIDDVRLYNYALTDYQVKQLYNLGVSTHFD